MVMLPVPVPQIILLGVSATLVIGGELLSVADTVNVHPKLLVNVITWVPAGNPVTVCPLTAPALLANDVMVCTPPDVLVITITPLLLPQEGFVNVSVAEGLGLIVAAITALEAGHPPLPGTV